MWTGQFKKPDETTIDDTLPSENAPIEPSWFDSIKKLFSSKSEESVPSGVPFMQEQPYNGTVPVLNEEVPIFDIPEDKPSMVDFSNKKPMGMAESLVQRSGDDLVNPPSITPVASSVKSPTTSDIGLNRKEEALKLEDEVVSPLDQEYIDAQKERDRLLMIMNIAKGAEKIGAGIGGTKSDSTYLDFLKDTAFNKVTDVEKKRDQEGKKIERQDKQYELAFKKQQDDPNSDISKFVRDYARKSYELIGQKPPELGNISAREFEKINPLLSNQINQIYASKERALLAQDRQADRELTRELRSEDKKFNQADKLRTEALKIDKETAYSASQNAVKRFNDLLNKKQWDGAADIEAVYTQVKLLDPGSTVREGEIKLSQQADPALSRFINSLNKFRKGDIISPDYRASILKSLGRLAEKNKQLYNSKMAGIRNQAKDAGIKSEYIEQLEDQSREMELPKKENEIERTLKDGRKAIFDSDTKQFIRWAK